MKVRPSISCVRYPFSSRRRRTVRIVESFIGRVEIIASRHASAVVEPWVQMKSITACSTSPRFLRRAGFELVIVTLHTVTLENESVKSSGKNFYWLSSAGNRYPGISIYCGLAGDRGRPLAGQRVQHRCRG